MKILILIYLVFIFPFVYQSIRTSDFKNIYVIILNTLFTFVSFLYLSAGVLTNLKYLINNSHKLYDIFQPIGLMPGFVNFLTFIMYTIAYLFFCILCIGIAVRSNIMRVKLLKYLPYLIVLDLIINYKLVIQNNESTHLIFITLIIEIVFYLFLKRIYTLKIFERYFKKA